MGGRNTQENTKKFFKDFSVCSRNEKYLTRQKGNEFQAGNHGRKIERAKSSTNHAKKQRTIIL